MSDSIAQFRGAIEFILRDDMHLAEEEFEELQLDFFQALAPIVTLLEKKFVELTHQEIYNIYYHFSYAQGTCSQALQR